MCDYMWGVGLAHSEQQPQVQVTQRSQERSPGGEMTWHRKWATLLKSNYYLPLSPRSLTLCPLLRRLQTDDVDSSEAS